MVNGPLIGLGMLGDCPDGQRIGADMQPTPDKTEWRDDAEADKLRDEAFQRLFKAGRGQHVPAEAGKERVRERKAGDDIRRDRPDRGGGERS